MQKTILIVDDEISIHTSLEYILKQHSIKAIHATNATEAIGILKKGLIPNMILMDFKMPGPNGIQLTKKIKSHPKLINIPIIGITAYASEENKKIAIKNGIQIILEKPFDLIELQRIINTYL